MSDLQSQPLWLQPASSSPAASASPAFPVAAVKAELTVADLWSVLARRRRVIFGTMLPFFAAAVLLCLVSTRKYEATASVQVQKDSNDALGLNSMVSEPDNSSDPLEANLNIQTQANILQSETLALKVIEILHLEQNKDFRPHFSPLWWAIGLLSRDTGPGDSARARLEDSPRRREHAFRVFTKNLKVKPISGTRVIQVSFVNSDPTVAAAVVNQLVRSMGDYSFQTRFNATSQAADWLGSQLSDLRKQSELLQTKAVALQRDSGVFAVGDSDPSGKGQLYSTVLDRLEHATTQLSQAESNRIVKGALYEVVKTGNAEMISGLGGNSAAAVSGSPGMSSALTLIQSLRSQEAAVQAQLSEMSAKFGPAYPKIAELHSNLDTIDKSIADEVHRVSERARNDYQVAQQVEASARRIFNEQRHEADAVNNKAVAYTIARQEADNSRTLYDSLLKKLKEAGVLAGFHISNLTIIDPARIPSKPATPNIPLYLGTSLGLGFVFGCCGALWRDANDRKIRFAPDLEATLGEPIFAVLPLHKESARSLSEVPWAKGASQMLPSESLKVAVRDNAPRAVLTMDFPVITEPRSPYTESLRALRTSVMLSKGGAPPQVLLVTSSVAAEGKSMLSVNMAALFAQQGKRVLLVDADLRRPVLHRRLKMSVDSGLSSLLAETGIEENAMKAPVSTDQIPGLDVLPAGPIPPYPAELLGSDQMTKAIHTWRAHYDFVVIDGAPVLPVTDSVLLSTRADLTLLVARHNMTERQALDRSRRLLHGQAGRSKVGLVLNAVDRHSNGYYEYYGYHAYAGEGDSLGKTA